MSYCVHKTTWNSRGEVEMLQKSGDQFRAAVELFRHQAQQQEKENVENKYISVHHCAVLSLHMKDLSVTV